MTAKASIDVEDLVRWTYSTQMADVLSERDQNQELAWLQAIGTNAGFVERYAALGCRVDCAGSAASAPAITAVDADTTHYLVDSLARHRGECRESAILLRLYGRIGIRPDWMADAPTRFEPVLNGKGKPKMIWKRSKPVVCRLRLIDPPELIAATRRQYRRWHDGLVVLAAILWRDPDQLVGHIVTGPRAPATPWNDSNV